MTALADTTLLRFLDQTSALYAAKCAELELTVSGWLGYVVQTFPHYTDHTIEHSAAIVDQLSKLLFVDDDPEQPVLSFSGVEAYVLIASAYLHDSGMVVSDEAKTDILRSSAWRDWISEGGGGHERWQDVQNLRTGSEPSDVTERHFVADVQLRYLLAEFVRKYHHERVIPVLAARQASLGRFAFDDPTLLETITAVCVGHGLVRTDLEDAYRYPDRRDVHGEAANVRLLAILLRIGDLLDLSHDRACPILLGAASPLPVESVAHWNQYQRIRHRSTTPDAIELDAECFTAEEHRLLQDWCHWLVEEIAAAPGLLAGSRRHAGWIPPVARMDGSGATITIRPAATATYIPSQWTFRLDPDAVVQRLVDSVSPDPLLFVRELIQNSLDATRRRLVDDYVRGDRHLESPADAPQTERDALPLKVHLVDERTGSAPPAQTLVIADNGCGMTSEKIERYLLQIGRSFYTTPEFRRRYRFSPTSRFGVGFLSVFKASERVTIETATHDDIAGGTGGLRLTLTGPRNYLLTERGSRREVGTEICVTMQQAVSPAEIDERVRRLCRRVEFSIQLDLLGSTSTVASESPSDFVWRKTLPYDASLEVEVKYFPVDRPHVSGELYVFTSTDASGESWVDAEHVMTSSRESHPDVTFGPMPSSVTCVNGLALDYGEPWGNDKFVQRLDYRRLTEDLGLARAGGMYVRGIASRDPEITAEWTSIVATHISSTRRAHGDQGWVYLQRLMARYPLDPWWLHVDGTVPWYEEGERRVTSIAELTSRERFAVIVAIHDYNDPPLELRLEPTRLSKGQLSRGADRPVLREADVNRLSALTRRALFDGRAVASMSPVGKNHLALEWEHADRKLGFDLSVLGGVSVASLPHVPIIGFVIHRVMESDGAVLINDEAPLIRWVAQLQELVSGPDHSSVQQYHVDTLSGLLGTPLRIRGYKLEDLVSHLDAWRASDMAEELRPPEVPLSTESFAPPGAPARRGYGLPSRSRERPNRA